MVWFGVVLFAAVGIGFIVWRNDLAYWEGMTFGGTVSAGCVLIQGALFLLAALIIYLVRASLAP